MFEGTDYSKETSAADKTAFEELVKGKSREYSLLDIQLLLIVPTYVSSSL